MYFCGLWLKGKKQLQELMDKVLDNESKKLIEELEKLISEDKKEKIKDLLEKLEYCRSVSFKRRYRNISKIP